MLTDLAIVLGEAVVRIALYFAYVVGRGFLYTADF
jgi:hypothetical protein